MYNSLATVLVTLAIPTVAHVYVGATGLFMPSAHSTCGGWPEGGKEAALQPKAFGRERESHYTQPGHTGSTLSKKI